MPLVGVECKLVYLTGVLMQAGKLYAGTVEVVEDDLAICSSRGYMRAELAVGPLDIVDAQALALAGVRVCIVEDSSTQISLVDDAGILDADRLEQLLAGEDGMGALAVDVEGRDVEARLVACMLRIACADTAEALSGMVGEMSVCICACICICST